MAIQISGNTVIDNNRNFVGAGLTISGGIYAGVGGTTGTSGQYLQSTGVGVTWATVVAGGGAGSGEFNVGITSVAQVKPLAYETTVLTFPSTVGRRYIIDSINVANISDEEINLIAALNYSDNGRKVHLAYNIPISSAGSVELLKQPHIANPSDFITMWSNDATYYGKNDALEIYITYTVSTDTNYFGVGISTVGIGTTAAVGIFTSTTYPSVLQSIHLTNRTDDGDYPISVQITNGLSTSFLVKNLFIPRYSTIELLDRPKRLELNGVISVSIAQTSTIDISVSGKKIA